MISYTLKELLVIDIILKIQLKYKYPFESWLFGENMNSDTITSSLPVCPCKLVSKLDVFTNRAVCRYGVCSYSKDLPGDIVKFWLCLDMSSVMINNYYLTFSTHRLEHSRISVHSSKFKRWVFLFIRILLFKILKFMILFRYHIFWALFLYIFQIYSSL